MGYLTHQGTGYFHEAQAHHDPAAFLRVAGQQLISAGYTLQGHGPGWLSAARGGVGHGFAGLDRPHRFVLRTDGARVRFEIFCAAGPWSQNQDTWRLDSAVGALLHDYDQASMRESLFGPTSRPVPQSVHVVERQVVVARCKFCRGHTPLDAPTCQHCGAAGFA